MARRKYGPPSLAPDTPTNCLALVRSFYPRIRHSSRPVVSKSIFWLLRSPVKAHCRSTCPYWFHFACKCIQLQTKVSCITLTWVQRRYNSRLRVFVQVTNGRVRLSPIYPPKNTSGVSTVLDWLTSGDAEPAEFIRIWSDENLRVEFHPLAFIYHLPHQWVGDQTHRRRTPDRDLRVSIGQHTSTCPSRLYRKDKHTSDRTKSIIRWRWQFLIYI